MSRDWSISSSLPRAYELFGERLPANIPTLEGSLKSKFGVSFSELAIGLFVLNFVYVGALDSGDAETPIPKPTYCHGVIRPEELIQEGTAGEVIQRVIDLHTITWDDLRALLSSQRLASPSILTFLRHPLIRISEHEVWCFDPSLVLSAGSNGLLWLAKDAYEASGGNVQRFFGELGKAFQDYLADFFEGMGLADDIQGDNVGEGLSDFFLFEDDKLVVIEAKASVMLDEVKWSADTSQLRHELDKVLKDNQIMDAIARLFRDHVALTKGIRRVIPLIVVLDYPFSSPGLERTCNEALSKPKVGCPIDDVHLLYVGDLEASGHYIRERVFSNLLDARREVMGMYGWRSIPTLIRRYRAEVESLTGMWLEPYDAQVSGRARLNAAMKRFSEEHSLPDPGW